MQLPTIKLGISRCLLGENVRYDGGHKLDHYLCDTLGSYVTFVPDGLVPLIAPVVLLRHFAGKFEEPYLLGQFYLNPHPLELKLRNHV